MSFYESTFDFTSDSLRETVRRARACLYERIATSLPACWHKQISFLLAYVLLCSRACLYKRTIVHGFNYAMLSKNIEKASLQLIQFISFHVNHFQHNFGLYTVGNFLFVFAFILHCQFTMLAFAILLHCQFTMLPLPVRTFSLSLASSRAESASLRIFCVLY